MSQAAAKTVDSPLPMFTKSLAEADPAIEAVVKGELHRQREQIELIASENIVSRAVLEAAGSVLTGALSRCTLAPAAIATAGANSATAANRLMKLITRVFI